MVSHQLKKKKVLLTLKTMPKNNYSLSHQFIILYSPGFLLSITCRCEIIQTINNINDQTSTTINVQTLG